MKRRIKQPAGRTIVFYIATLTRGGAERVIVNLANYFCRQGYRVYMVTLEPDEGLYPMEEGIRKLVLDVSGAGGGPTGRLRSALGRITQVRGLLKRTQAQALVSFIGKTNIRAILAALGTDTKVFVSVRSAPEREYAGLFQRLLAKTLFCLADGIIFQSEGARSFFPKAAQRKSRILLNPLAPEYAARLSEDDTQSPRRMGGKPMDADAVSGAAGANPTGDAADEVPGASGGALPGGGAAARRGHEIVTVGRMDKVKNHALLIDAFAIARKEKPELRLTIYGGGDCMEAIREQVGRLGITQAVSLPGDCRDIPDKIKDARLFVLSSDYEGMPNAVAEAFAMKLPVVSTDCPSGGARALVQDGVTGLLVPVGDAGKMAEAILRILNDSGLEERIRRGAYEFAQTLHPDKINRQWLEYIEGR